MTNARKTEKDIFEIRISSVKKGYSTIDSQGNRIIFVPNTDTYSINRENPWLFKKDQHTKACLCITIDQGKENWDLIKLNEDLGTYFVDSLGDNGLDSGFGL